MHARTTSNAICREPGGRIGRHKESRSCFSILPWLRSTAESKIPAGRNQHVSASAGLEKELYRDPQRSNRTAQRRSTVPTIVQRIVPAIAGHIRSSCRPPPRPHGRAARARRESRVICPSRDDGRPRCKTGWQSLKAEPRSRFTDRRIPVPTVASGRAQHRPIWEELA
jgi:hypothetical protein